MPNPPMAKVMSAIEEYLVEVLEPIDVYNHYTEVVMPEMELQLQDYTPDQISKMVEEEKQYQLRCGHWWEIKGKCFLEEDIFDQIEDIQHELESF